MELIIMDEAGDYVEIPEDMLFGIDLANGKDYTPQVIKK